MAREWKFPVEVPDTDDVYAAYRQWYDPAYGNPDAQAAWEKANAEEFKLWLERIRSEARSEGYRQGVDTARSDMVSGAFIAGMTYETLKASFSGRKIHEEGYREGYAKGRDDVWNPPGDKESS